MSGPQFFVSKSNVYCDGDDHDKGDRLIPLGERYALSEDGEQVLCERCYSWPQEEQDELRS